MSEPNPRPDDPGPSSSPSKEERDAGQAAEPIPDRRVGQAIVWASWVGTAALVVTAVPAVISPSGLVAPFVFVSLGLFAAGILAFFVAYGGAVSRSRTDLIGIGGLYFLAGSAPTRVRWHLLGSLAAQVVVGVISASVRVYTPLAFGILAPMWGLGLCGLWASRYGVFPPRGAPAGGS